MTSKEALAFISKKAFQYIEGSYPVFDEEGFENYEKSQRVLGVLIERDTPKKVEIGTSKHFKFPICPNCKVELNEYYKNKYCKECGQRIMWSKDDE